MDIHAISEREMVALRDSAMRGDGWPGGPPARGTRTIRMCSFDARNRGSTRLPVKGTIRAFGRIGEQPPDHPSCSQSPHGETVVAQCAQYRAASATPLRAMWKIEICSLYARSGKSISPIPEERTKKFGGIICNPVRLPQVDQHGCPSKREKAMPPVFHLHV